METTSGFIIVLKVAKNYVKLDLTRYEAENSDFLAFQSVPPGLHHVSAGLINIGPGLWFNLQPNEVLVKVFNYNRERFDDASPETTAHYQQLVLNGEISEGLETYRLGSEKKDRWGIWQKLTKHLDMRSFPPTIHPPEAIDPPANLSLEERENFLQHQKTRFEIALFDTHQGDTDAFLAEFQFAFLSHHTDYRNYKALKRWNYLVDAIYNAGLRGIAKAPTLFPSLIDTLIAQLECWPNKKLTPGYVISCGLGAKVKVDVVSEAEHLIAHMIDSGIEGVVEKGHEFAAYLDKRGIIGK